MEMKRERRIEILKGSAKFIRAYETEAQIEKWWLENPQAIGIAFVGRSNVGKSSLINALFGNKTAKTSKTPGRTQKINIFTFKISEKDNDHTFYLYDLPGYGHAQVSKAMTRNWRVLMDTFFRKMNPYTMLINVQDARHPDQKSDHEFHEYINPNEIDIYLVFNKIDKLKKQKERAALDKLKPALKKAYKRMKKIFYTSAEKRSGLDPLNDSLVEVFKKHQDYTDGLENFEKKSEIPPSLS